MTKSVNETGMKRAMLINDLSCLGKCSLSVGLPIVSACGVEAVALPTAVLSTHTGGFEGYVVRDMTEDMRVFAAHWKAMGVRFDCIYTGFFASAEQIDVARQVIRDFADSRTLVMVDPVLGDNGRLYPCFDQEYVARMRSLCAMAHVITPNYTEAALLAGKPVTTPPEELLDALDVPNVIITGVHEGEWIGYRARLGVRKVTVDKLYMPMTLHGTGDVFASALCGEMMRGRPLFRALQEAADFCDACIRKTAERQPGHWYGLAFEDVLKERMKA